MIDKKARQSRLFFCLVRGGITSFLGEGYEPFFFGSSGLEQFIEGVRDELTKIPKKIDRQYIYIPFVSVVCIGAPNNREMNLFRIPISAGGTRSPQQTRGLECPIQKLSSKFVLKSQYPRNEPLSRPCWQYCYPTKHCYEFAPDGIAGGEQVPPRLVLCTNIPSIAMIVNVQAVCKLF